MICVCVHISINKCTTHLGWHNGIANCHYAIHIWWHILFLRCHLFAGFVYIVYNFEQNIVFLYFKGISILISYLTFCVNSFGSDPLLCCLYFSLLSSFLINDIFHHAQVLSSFIRQQKPSCGGVVQHEKT